MQESILDDEMFADANTLLNVEAEGGKKLSDLVRQLNSIQQQITDAEEHLKALKSEKQKISIENIPMLIEFMIK